MKRTFFLSLLLCLFGILPNTAFAQQNEENVISFFSTNATMEDDPNQHTYFITIFSPDGQWKMQLNYHSDNMFGTFTNDDFRLSGEGRYYNFARNPKNEMVFYSFKDMEVSVTDETRLYRVKANCLTNNNMRFIVEATIDVPMAETTLTDDLGYARVQPNGFMGTYTIHAENDNFKLGYGIVGSDLLGTFYRADMLLPELLDKKTGANVEIVDATAVHTQDGENTKMHVELLGADKVLYALDMFNGPYEVKIEREEDIFITGAILQDITSMYGCYQFGGMNRDYQLAIAIKQEAMESGRRSWTKDDVILQYTNLLDMATNSLVEIFDIKVWMEQGQDVVLVKADLTTMEGTLYHITMQIEQDGYMPQPTETVNIDLGHISVLDYSRGMGLVGFGAYRQNECQIRFYLATHTLEGNFTTSDFDIDQSDIMIVTGGTYVFHDAKYMKAHLEKRDGRTYITADMYCVNDVLYHVTMYMDDMACLHDREFKINNQSGVLMVGLHEEQPDGRDVYTVQFQDMDNVYDEDYRIIGDGHALSFTFVHEGKGIDGDYGYSEGTLAEDPFTFFENGCEVRVAPVAGTLKLEAVEPVRVVVDRETINTYLYRAAFQVVGQNGSLYEGRGQNFFLCLDEDGAFEDVDETVTAINEALAEKGYQVRKVVRNGKLIIEVGPRTYDLQGRQIELK